jgi:methyltransferase
LSVFAGIVLGAAMALRWWTLATLGERWTTRVLVVPGEEMVSSGPYRWLRHPNYLAVVLEIAAIPMIHCAWLTALVFTIANLVLLRERIRVEEEALSRLATGGTG